MKRRVTTSESSRDLRLVMRDDADRLSDDLIFQGHLIVCFVCFFSGLFVCVFRFQKNGTLLFFSP